MASVAFDACWADLCWLNSENHLDFLLLLPPLLLLLLLLPMLLLCAVCATNQLTTWLPAVGIALETDAQSLVESIDLHKRHQVVPFATDFAGLNHLAWSSLESNRSVAERVYTVHWVRRLVLVQSANHFAR